ncbi:hypothetical protein D3C81_1178510 [compost metagenome]
MKGDQFFGLDAYRIGFHIEFIIGYADFGKPLLNLFPFEDIHTDLKPVISQMKDFVPNEIEEHFIQSSSRVMYVYHRLILNQPEGNLIRDGSGEQKNIR